MSIVVVREPAEISFSKNPIVYKLQSDARIDNPGAAAVNELEFVGNIVDGTVVVLRWKGEQQRMVARDVVSNPGFEFPSGTVGQAYIEQILPYFKDNFYLDRDFVITLLMTSVSGGWKYTIKFTAKEPGRENQFIPQSTPSVKIKISTPGIDVVLKPNFKIQAELWIQKPGVNDFEMIFSEPLEVDNSGSAEWDIANLLHPELSPDFHNWSGRSLNRDIKSKRQYYIRYAEAWGDRFQVGKVFKHTTKHVTMGGTPYEAGPAVKVKDLLLEGTDPTRDRCLRYGPDVRFIFPDEPAFLSYINVRSPGYATFQMKVTAKMSFSGNADVITIPLNNGLLLKYDRVTANAGFAQLGLNQLVTTDAVESYTCQFFEGTTPVSRPYTFVIDYSNKPYRRYFTYHNSLGAFDSMHIWGKGSNEIELTKQTAKNYLKPDYAYTDGTFDDWDLTYRQKFQAATGYRQKAEIRMFKDFYISRYKHRFTESKPLPVTILSSSVKEFEDGNHFYAQTFEYAYQFDDDTVTEDLEDSSLSYSPPPGFLGATGGPIVVAVPPAPGYGSDGQLLYDQVPTEGSANIPRSGGVWSELQKLQIKLPIGALGQYIRGDHTLGNFSQDIAPLIQNELIKFKAEQLPKWITADNSSARIAAGELNDSANESGMYYAAAVTKAAGWPVDSLGASLIRVYDGAPGLRRGSDTVHSSEGRIYVRTLSEAETHGPWKEITPGEEPTFSNIPVFRFPIGQTTIQVIDLAKYLVSTHTLPLQMKELNSPEWIQSITIDGLKATVSGLPTNSKEKGIVVEVTDTETGKSRTVSIPVEPRAQVNVKYNLYNPVGSAVVAEIPQNNTGSFVNPEKLDIQIVVADEPHDGVYAAIVGGGPDNVSVNEKWTDKEFEQLPDIVNGGVYRMWSYINGRSVPAGTYQFLFKVFLKGQEVYSKTVSFTLTAAPIGQADFELWDESVGSGYKVTDIATDNSTVVQPIGQYDVRFAVKGVLHNQVYAKITDEAGTHLFGWGLPYESVTQTTDHVYQLFGPGSTGHSPGTAGIYHVYLQAFLNGVQVYAKDNIFEIADEGTPPTGSARYEYWDETTSTATKVGDILFNNSSSFPVKSKGEIKINVFNVRHNQVYAEIRNSSGAALFTFNKPYETVATAENAIYQMFGNGSWTNITPGSYQIYFKAQMDGNVVYEKTAAFVLTSETPTNPITLQLRNITANTVVGTITNGSSFPLPSSWDIITTVSGPHDAWTAILDKKINGSYDNSNLWFNQDSTVYPGSASVIRHVFNGQGNTRYETASRILKEGQYRLVVTSYTGGTGGIVVSQNQVEFTLTAAITPTISGIELWHKNPDTSSLDAYLFDLDLPVIAGSIAQPSSAIDFRVKRVNSTVRRFDAKIEEYKNGAFYPLDLGAAGPFSLGPSGAEKIYSYKWVDRDGSFSILNDVMGVGGVGNIYDNGAIVANLNRSNVQYRVTVWEKDILGNTVKTRVTTFSFGSQPSTGLAPFSVTPKILFNLKNENGVYSDVTPDEFVENGVKYRNVMDSNGQMRKYKIMYWINERPWANGDTPKDLGKITLRNGLLISIRKCYADVNWVGSHTFADFVSRGWDFWGHGGENPNADLNLMYRTILLSFTTNGGTNLGHGSMLREENPSWMAADKMVPQYFWNASPYGISDKPTCVQCVPFLPSPQETADRLAFGGVTHIWWQNIHGAGLYQAPAGIPTPGVDLHGMKPCFNLASQQYHDTLGSWFVFGMQATRDQARQVADNTPLIDGAVYTDEFTEGSFPQFEQSREWFYERFAERAAAAGITYIQGGDYGYGSQNVTLRSNPGRYDPMGSYMKSLTGPDVVANLDSVGVTSHLKFKQYAMYHSAYRDCVIGGYYAITEHPLSERMAVKPLEAIITINAVPGKGKVGFYAGFMQSNANGTDVPYKDSGTIKPDGSINYNYPDVPAELMKVDGFMCKLLYEAAYIWDMYGVKLATDINSWYGSNFGTDAFIVGCRMYDKCIPYLNAAGRELIACDFVANGVAFNSTTTERRISRKGHPYYNNIYFNEVLARGGGLAIVIPSPKKAILYYNFYRDPTQIEDVTVIHNGVSYHIGEVAGSTMALCFEP